MGWKRVLMVAVSLAIAVVVLSERKAVQAAGDDSAVADKWIAAWNSHDPEKMLSTFTDDVYYEDVTFAEVSRGQAEFRKFAAEEFEGVPDLEIKLMRAAVHNGHGTIEWSFSGTDKGVYKTGKKFTVRGVSVIEVRDGKISRSVDYYDAATIMRQVGVLPDTK